MISGHVMTRRTVVLPHKEVFLLERRRHLVSIDAKQLLVDDDGKVEPDRVLIAWYSSDDQAGQLLQPFADPTDSTPTCCGSLLEAAQLLDADQGADFRELAVESRFCAITVGHLAEVADRFHPRQQLLVVRAEAAAFHGGKRLGRVETEDLCIPKSAAKLAIDPGTERGRAVKQHGKSLTTADLAKRRIVASNAVGIHSQDGDGPHTYLSLHISRIKAHGAVIDDVGKYWFGTTPAHCMWRGGKGERWNDDLATFDAGGLEHRHQRQLAVAKCEGWNAEIPGQLTLELNDPPAVVRH